MLRRLPAIVLGGALVIAAFSTGADFLFFLLYLGLLVVGGSYLVTRFGLADLEAGYALDRLNGQVGEALRVTYTIRNAGRLPKLWLEAFNPSTLPVPLPGRALVLGPRAERSWAARVPLVARGHFRVDPLVIRTGDPFGLFEASAMVGSGAGVTIYPRVEPLPRWRLPASTLEGTSATPERTSQATPLVTSIRPYAPGDAYNRIHWKSSARHQELQVKEFDLEQTADLWIYLDLDRRVQAGEGDEATLEAGGRGGGGGGATAGGGRARRRGAGRRGHARDPRRGHPRGRPPGGHAARRPRRAAAPEDHVPAGRRRRGRLHPARGSAHPPPAAAPARHVRGRHHAVAGAGVGAAAGQPAGARHRLGRLPPRPRRLRHALAACDGASSAGPRSPRRARAGGPRHAPCPRRVRPARLSDRARPQARRAARVPRRAAPDGGAGVTALGTASRSSLSSPGERTLAPAEGWSTVLLLAALLAAVGFALDDARWVGTTPDGASQTWFVPAAILLGAAWGLVGAKARMPALVVHLIGAAIGSVVVIVLVAGVVSGAPDLLERLRGLNASLEAFAGDVFVRHLRSRETSVFLLVVGLVGWGTGAFAACAVFRRRRPLSAILMAGLLLLANLSLTFQPQFVHLVVFAAASLLLLVRANLVEQRAGWVRRRIGDSR